MGDNREESWDSRFWGFVPRTLVSGRPLLVYWSYDTSRDEYTQTSLSQRVSQIFDLIIHFPTKTRWRRMFRIVR
jgi:signal peptidase I